MEWRASKWVLYFAWDNTANYSTEKRLNIDYLACNLPAEAAKVLEDHWTEYWEGETAEARLAHDACVFEHMVALDEDGVASGDFTQPVISSPELRSWMSFMHSSKAESVDLQNNASFGISYWHPDPEESMRLLAEVIKAKSISSSLVFIRMAKHMSTIKRRGWMKRGMDPSVVESNASHPWRVALICLLFSPKVCLCFRCLWHF